MSPDLSRPFENPGAAQQRFLSLFLRSERENFHYAGVLVPNVADAEDIVPQTALSFWKKFESYDPNQPFTSWDCRTALNKANQWIERRYRCQGLLASYDDVCALYSTGKPQLAPLVPSRN